MKTVLSGIQPTGNLHLGNYLGSIRNWIDLQKTHRCIFGIMNLHAITLPQDPKELEKNVLDAAAMYIACGLNPEKSTIFVQSHVPEHAELAWVLGCITPMGWLNRMTQFKDKSKMVEAYSGLTTNLHEVLKVFLDFVDKGYEHEKVGIRNLEDRINNNNFNINHQDYSEEEFVDLMKENLQLRKENYKLKTDTVRKVRSFNKKCENTLREYDEKRRNIDNQIKAVLGLYAYPTLMASDILLYRADLVPVGEDQKQHLELTRDLAGAFNRRFGKEYFKLPEPMILKEVKRIMSLQDGTKKMSKSDESDLSRINLIDSPEQIVKKVKKAKTDSLSTVTFDEARPEIYNLLNIFSAITDRNPEEIAKEYENSGYGKFKGDLADALVAKLAPIQEELFRIREDEFYLKRILSEGQKAASEIAQQTKKEVFEIVGLN